MLTSHAANSTTAIAPLVTFAIFTISARSTGQTLSTASAYTALSLVTLLSTPMNIFVQAVPNFNAAMACFARISSFLNSDIRRDHRLPLRVQNETSSNASDSARDVGTEMTNLRPNVSQAKASSAMITAQSVSFAWNEESGPVVQDLTFSIQRGHLCFLIGPVGSGKTTMLKGLLGETPSSEGFIYSDTSEIAFVDQSPWIRNGTVRWFSISYASEILYANIILDPRKHPGHFSI